MRPDDAAMSRASPRPHTPRCVWSEPFSHAGFENCFQACRIRWQASVFDSKVYKSAGRVPADSRAVTVLPGEHGLTFGRVIASRFAQRLALLPKLLPRPPRHWSIGISMAGGPDMLRDGVMPEGPGGQLLAAALTLATLCALLYGCVLPLIAWHGARAEALAQRRTLLQRMTMVVATLPDLQRQAFRGRAPAAALMAGSSDAIAGAALQVSIQKMAAAAGAELGIMETLPTEQRGAYRRIALRVSTAAPWPAMITLLNAIEAGAPRVLIEDLQLRAPMVELVAASRQVSATFTVVTFRAAAPAAAESSVNDAGAMDHGD